MPERYLNSSIPSDDNNLEIPGYGLIRADQPFNSKRGGVCVYYRNSLPLKILDIFYLQEGIVFELKIGNKSCKIVYLYRSPNQSQDEFETFTNNLELILDMIFETNPFLVIALGDFNAKLSQWYKNDKTTTEGSKIANLTSRYGLKRTINQPTHILNNLSSCINLLLTSQPNLLMESGVHSSLHSNCHHQIIYARFNLKIYYPPRYEREIWHYKKTNIDLIQQAIREFNWERAFHRKNINAKVSISNNTINNVLSNFIPHETITCDHKKPTWFNKNVINLIKNKSIFYKSHTGNENSTYKKGAIKALQNMLTSTIENPKSEYCSKLSMKLSN